MKLYHWDDLDTLEQYMSGQAFALASSKEEAIDLVVEDRDFESDKLRAELTEKEPAIYDSPVGFAIVGSA